ncbi:MAG TPA: 50S ribosomal protein L11 methyltransferase [Bacteroidia bacterium]|nr:50S ribosomal protein L11 methyltransferase [Bacteroidia bacterium]
MDYIEILFTSSNPEFSSEILSALLADAGFDMFQDTDEGVAAYIPEEHFNRARLEKITAEGIPAFTGMKWTSRKIPYVNWNAEWEKNFTPVTVDDKVHIRAEYHPATDAPYEIVIRPGMAFGTGHHATTRMMVARMLEMDFKAKKVLDMGTGSGVLAILAEKLGAAGVTAADYDGNAAANAEINIRLNNCQHVTALKGTVADITDTDFDSILANINRNILLDDIPGYARALKPEGNLVLSGFYSEDLQLIREKAREFNFELTGTLLRNNWCAASFKKGI